MATNLYVSVDIPTSNGVVIILFQKVKPNSDHTPQLLTVKTRVTIERRD